MPIAIIGIAGRTTKVHQMAGTFVAVALQVLDVIISAEEIVLPSVLQVPEQVFGIFLPFRVRRKRAFIPSKGEQVQNTNNHGHNKNGQEYQ